MVGACHESGGNGPGQPNCTIGPDGEGAVGPDPASGWIYRILAGDRGSMSPSSAAPRRSPLGRVMCRAHLRPRAVDQIRVLWGLKTMDHSLPRARACHQPPDRRFNTPMKGRRAHLPRARAQRQISQEDTAQKGQIGSSDASVWASGIIRGRPAGWSPSSCSPTPHRSPHGGGSPGLSSQVAVVSPSGPIWLRLPMRPVPVWVPPD